MMRVVLSADSSPPLIALSVDGMVPVLKVQGPPEAQKRCRVWEQEDKPLGLIKQQTSASRVHYPAPTCK